MQNGQEILNLENHLKELDKARNDLITLITSGACAEDTLDAEFMKIHDEEREINEKLSELQKSIKISEDTQSKIDSAMQTISNENFQLDTFDDVIIRKLSECVRVISNDTVQIIFKGEIEVMAKIEK